MKKLDKKRVTDVKLEIFDRERWQLKQRRNLKKASDYIYQMFEDRLNNRIGEC